MIRQKLPGAPGVDTDGPFDIELGFRDNKLWLFQIRPFVENKNAQSQVYLESLNPELGTTPEIELNQSFTDSAE